MLIEVKIIFFHSKFIGIKNYASSNGANQFRNINSFIQNPNQIQQIQQNQQQSQNVFINNAQSNPTNPLLIGQNQFNGNNPIQQTTQRQIGQNQQNLNQVNFNQFTPDQLRNSGFFTGNSFSNILNPQNNSFTPFNLPGQFTNVPPFLNGDDNIQIGTPFYNEAAKFITPKFQFDFLEYLYLNDGTIITGTPSDCYDTVINSTLENYDFSDLTLSPTSVMGSDSK